MDGVQALIFEAGRRPATYLANSASMRHDYEPSTTLAVPEGQASLGVGGCITRQRDMAHRDTKWDGI